MSGRLQGTRIVVTGASRGLGRALAEAFAAEGAALVVTATTAARADAAAARVRDAGGQAHGVALDLADPVAIEAASAQAIGALGRVDVLVNNASLLGVRAALAEYPADVWDAVLAVNLTGTLALTRALLPGIAHGGAVVNVSSGAAGRAGWGAYGVSKLALEGATAMLREELADRAIRCVAVNPGGLRTSMRAAAYPREDPATVPHPSSVVAPFLAIAEGADPGPRIDAPQWRP
ncbi:SDR family NAD(P)-dependent oxidoreductase [Miltoncostaea marina]|uniref:SDR family NAD(P)-dependent oxidoreductase n=1 Tax=Miltoncostaea marina TaxID=2843215 RepID=UPI001C3C3E55|nr:SDR family NAD(P)-dependent oxidoreductase [Miltoncostaea marina]